MVTTAMTRMARMMRMMIQVIFPLLFEIEIKRIEFMNYFQAFFDPFRNPYFLPLQARRGHGFPQPIRALPFLPGGLRQSLRPSRVRHECEYILMGPIVL